MKKIIVVLDGALDCEMDGQTPLRAAAMPYLDKLCKFAQPQRLQTIADNEAISSFYGNMTLLDYPERLPRLGRSLVELYSLKQALHEGSYSYRMNLISYQRASDRIGSTVAYGVDDRENTALLQTFREALAPYNIEVYSLMQHIYLLKTEQDFGGLLTSTAAIGCKHSEITSHNQILDAIRADIATVLKRHPLNAERQTRGQHTIDNALIWAKSEAIRRPLKQRRDAWAVISATPIVLGLAQLIGDEIIQRSTFTGTDTSDFTAKAVTALQQLENHSLVYCHLDAPDYLSHLLQRRAKRLLFEKIDREFFSVLYTAFRQRANFELLITADHGTSSLTGEHINRIVPVAHVTATATYGKCHFDEDFAAHRPLLNSAQWRGLLQS